MIPADANAMSERLAGSGTGLAAENSALKARSLLLLLANQSVVVRAEKLVPFVAYAHLPPE